MAAPQPGTAASGAVENDVCSHCHSSPSAPVPFVTPRGVKDPTARGAGAHNAHLGAGPMRAALSCADCHPVPTTPAGHYGSGVAEVKFGALARKGGLEPTWDRTSGTCSNTWCHGGGLKTPKQSSPAWNAAGSARCDTCHGAPPAVPHPQRTDCNSCHGGTVKPDGTIDIGGGLHVNGSVDAPSAGCASCHGDPSRSKVPAAPPQGSRGEKETTAIAVGAHQSHLQAGKLRGPIDCGECHVVPTDLSHVDGTARVSFGVLARTAGANPSWDRTTASCSASYCHGGTLKGGTNTTPRWTKVDGTQAACGSCHSLPPPAPHPQNTNCSSCHPGTVNADGTLIVSGGLHMNGVVDLAGGGGGLSCTSCHGSATNPAPPVGTRGETATTSRAVGAHQSHLQAGPFARALQCTECHVVPSSTSHADGKVDLAFGPLATTGGATPQWSGASCSAAYCHGNFPGGNASNAPQWTKVDGTQAACGSCHGLPPTNHSPTSTSCGSCHPGYTSTSVNLALHVDGKVDLNNLSCTSCHGDSSRSNAAPPVGTRGETATTDRAVGAHQAHLGDGPLRNALPCSECHVVPTSTSHSDGTVKLTFGALATTGGASPLFNGTSCSASYCHGNFKGGIAANAPQWTKVDGTQAACGTCHSLPPPAPHPQNTNCNSCHPGTVNSDGTLNARGGLHINGVVDVINLSCTSCHGSGTDPAPPAGTHGETATTARAVGAHQSHLKAGPFSRAVSCTECHVVPSGIPHADGKVDLSFGLLATTGGATPQWNGASCSAAYCHGNFRGGNAANAPQWTKVDGTQAACGTCHGTPPPAPHPPSTNCGSCHTGYTSTSVNLSLHINGKVDVNNLTCTSCHGSGTDPAPPLGTRGETATTARAVGAHQQHLKAGPLAGALACSECHVVPTSTSHSDGTVKLTFGTLATTGGAVPSWSGASCTASYCHGNFSGGIPSNAPVWTKVDGTQAACGTCHSSQPTTGHHGTHRGEGIACGKCHTGYGTTTVNASLHVNGKKDLDPSTGWNAQARSCANSCHGTHRW